MTISDANQFVQQPNICHTMEKSGKMSKVVKYRYNYDAWPFTRASCTMAARQGSGQPQKK